MLGTGVSMVQLGLYVFALSTVAMKITHLTTESVPTGLGGVYGNKGAVAIGFQYNHSTR